MSPRVTGITNRMPVGWCPGVKTVLVKRGGHHCSLAIRAARDARHGLEGPLGRGLLSEVPVGLPVGNCGRGEEVGVRVGARAQCRGTSSRVNVPRGFGSFKLVLASQGVSLPRPWPLAQGARSKLASGHWHKELARSSKHCSRTLGLRTHHPQRIGSNHDAHWQFLPGQRTFGNFESVDTT